MQAPLQIDPRNLPLEGKVLKGSRPAAFFELPAQDRVRAVGPLEFDLLVQRDDKDLIVTGTLEAPFQLECGVCLEPVHLDLALLDYRLEQEIQNESMIDLTTDIREDILLALPDYPRCEDDTRAPRDCSVPRLLTEVSAETESEHNGPPQAGIWDALDQIEER